MKFKIDRPDRQVVRRSLLIRCQRLATVATLIVWALAQSRRDGHRSLVTPKRVLSEYNEDLIFF